MYNDYCVAVSMFLGGDMISGLQESNIIEKVIPHFVGKVYFFTNPLSKKGLLLTCNNKQPKPSEDQFVIEYSSLPQYGILEVDSIRQLMWDSRKKCYFLDVDRGPATITIIY